MRVHSSCDEYMTLALSLWSASNDHGAGFVKQRRADFYLAALSFQWAVCFETVIFLFKQERRVESAFKKSA